MNADIFADAGLIFPAPFTGCVATNFVKGASKVVDGFEADQFSNLFQSAIGVLNQFLRFTNPILHQVSHG